MEQRAALRAVDTWTVAEVVSAIEGTCCFLFGLHLAFGQVSHAHPNGSTRNNNYYLSTT